MRFSTVAAFAASTLPLLAASMMTGTPAAAPMVGATDIADWRNPYQRPKFDEHVAPPGPAEDKILAKRQSGSSDFIVHMCHDATQTNCDVVWVSAAQYCYDNAHWFGWKGGAIISVKIEGTMCCAFYAALDCNKANNYLGWTAQVCQDDTGDALQIPAGAQAYMCNVPYGSANTKMANSPPDVSTIPANAGVAVATSV